MTDGAAEERLFACSRRLWFRLMGDSLNPCSQRPGDRLTESAALHGQLKSLTINIFRPLEALSKSWDKLWAIFLSPFPSPFNNHFLLTHFQIQV